MYVYVHIHTDTSDILQWFLIHCCITQDGYKEREDRIAELEEFINDQVAELDKMEGTMKQTIANKKILEEDYQVCVCVSVPVSGCVWSMLRLW